MDNISADPLNNRHPIKTYLSINEKKVLLGMVKYPNLNDRQISEIIGLKLSTFTAIKNRLKKNDYFSTVRFPMMDKLGMEIHFVIQVRLDTSRSIKDRQDVMIEFLENWPGVYYSIMESENLITLGYSENYTEFRTKFDDLEHILFKNGLVEKRKHIKPILFPIGISIPINNFNHTRIIEDHFGVEFKPQGVGDDYDNIEDLMANRSDGSIYNSFTSTEKKVLMGLIEYPELPDNKIALKVGTTRQAVARIKRKLDKKGVVKSVKIPNLKELGFEIISFTHMAFKATSDMTQRKEAIGSLVTSSPLPVVFHILNDTDSVIISAHRNFEEYQVIKGLVSSLYNTGSYLKEEPTLILFSNSSMDVVKAFRFGNLMRRILED